MRCPRDVTHDTPGIDNQTHPRDILGCVHDSGLHIPWAISVISWETLSRGCYLVGTWGYPVGTSWVISWVTILVISWVTLEYPVGDIPWVSTLGYLVGVIPWGTYLCYPVGVIPWTTSKGYPVDNTYISRGYYWYIPWVLSREYC